MPYSLNLICTLGFLLQASSFYLGDYNHSRNGSMSEGDYENKTKIRQEILEFELSGKINATRQRDNEEDKEAIIFDKAENFINCIFTFDGSVKPKYVCTYGNNVKMEWHRENERLIGIFSTSLDCPTQKSFGNVMENQRSNGFRGLEQLTRAKRQDEAEPAPTEEAEEAESTPAEETQEEAQGEDNNEVPADETEDKTASEEESNENEDASETEKNDKEADVVDEEVPAQEVPENVDEEVPAQEVPEDVNEEVPAQEVPEDVNEEVPAQEVPEDADKKEDPVVESEKDKKQIDVEPEVAKDNENSDRTDNGKDKDKNDNDKPASDDNNAKIDDLETDIGRELNLSETDIWACLEKLKEIFADAGDYILSLLLRDLKRGLHHSRANEKFDAVVQKLASTRDGNSEKAMNVLKNEIHKQFGRSYEIELVRFLKALQESYKV